MVLVLQSLHHHFELLNFVQRHPGLVLIERPLASRSLVKGHPCTAMKTTRHDRCSRCTLRGRSKGSEQTNFHPSETSLLELTAAVYRTCIRHRFCLAIPHFKRRQRSSRSCPHRPVLFDRRARYSVHREGQPRPSGATQPSKLRRQVEQTHDLVLRELGSAHLDFAIASCSRTVTGLKLDQTPSILKTLGDRFCSSGLGMRVIVGCRVPVTQRHHLPTPNLQLWSYPGSELRTADRRREL